MSFVGMIQFILKFLAILILSISLSLWVLQNNKAFQSKIIKNIVQMLEDEWDANISIQEYKLNFFTFSVYLKNASVISLKHGNCYWKFESGKISFAPFDFLIKKKISPFISLFNIYAKSHFNNRNIDLGNHILDVFTPRSDFLKVRPQIIKLENLSLDLIFLDKKLTTKFYGQFKIKKNYTMPYGWDGHIDIKDGEFLINGKSLIAGISTSYTFRKTNQSFKINPIKNIKIDNIAGSSKNPSTIQFYLDNKYYKMFLRNKSTNLSAIFFDDKIKVSGSFPLKLAADISQIIATQKDKPKPGLHDISGNCLINLDIPFSYSSNKNLGSASIQNMKIGKTKIDLCNFEKIYFDGNNLTSCVKMQNKTKNDSNLPKFDLQYSHNKNSIELIGKAFGQHFFIQAITSPYLHLSNITIGQKENPSLVLKTHSKNKNLQGFLKYSFIKSFIFSDFNQIILGKDSQFHLDIDNVLDNKINGTISLCKGKLYIPHARNIIKNLKTNFSLNIAEKSIEFNSLNIMLGKGIIKSPRMELSLDNNLSLKTMFVPIEINDLFVGWKKDFYGLLSGNVLCTKWQKSSMKFSGDIILKKSLLKDNIFSPDLKQDISTGHLFNHDFECNFNITSESPVKVETYFLETNAHINLLLQYSNYKNMINTTEIIGNITLDGGLFKFLRNNLSIEFGKIQFIKNQFLDPMVDLTARNRINKYLVTMNTTGSIQKPNVTLHATPELTEEQILGLLLIGSENTTLQADFPEMVMHNFNSVLFGGNKTLPKSKKFLEKLTRPLRYLQITPDFTDQSGRGGIKGTISVDIDKRFHAKIHKNFNLQEDFAFQVEYLLSDDINLRVMKDQRGDLGSEVEVKFKL
jgi:hypothetical protein